MENHKLTTILLLVVVALSVALLATGTALYKASDNQSWFIEQYNACADAYNAVALPMGPSPNTLDMGAVADQLGWEDGQ